MDGSGRAPTVLWVLFGLNGRIGRQSYILGQLLMIALCTLAVVRIFASTGNNGQTALWIVVLMALSAASLFSMFALTIKRLHDIGFSGMLSLLLFVPTVNLVTVVLLMAVPSQSRENRYGQAPFAEIR